MTVYADSITADQRIKLDHPPDTQEEQALVQALKDYGYGWKGYGDKGAWHGKKDTVEMWTESTFRARIKKNVVGLSFYDTSGTAVNMATYIEHVKSFDANALDDDLVGMAASTVAPGAPTTPSKPSGSGSTQKRPRS